MKVHKFFLKLSLAITVTGCSLDHDSVKHQKIQTADTLKTAITKDKDDNKNAEASNKAPLDDINPVGFSPDGKTVATSSSDNTIRLWDIKSEQVIRVFEGHKAIVNSITFSPDGNLLASGSDDMSINLWEVKSGRLLKNLKGHKDPVNSVIFNPDGKTIATSSEGNLRLWSIPSGDMLHSQDAKWPVPDLKKPLLHDNYSKVEYSKANKRPVTEEDIAKLRPILKLEDFKVDFSKVRKPPLKASNRALKRYADQLCMAMGMHIESTPIFSFSPNGKQLATGSFTSGENDKGIQFWNIKNGGLVKSREVGLVSTPTALGFCSDGKMLASATEAFEIQILDIKTNRLLKRFNGHTQLINAVSFSPDCKRLVSGSDDKTIKLWDVASGRLLKSLEGEKQHGHTGPVTSINFSPDGKLFISASTDGSINTWKATKQYPR